MTMGILTELTDDQQKKNELAIEAIDAIEALLQAYDPDSKLSDDIHDDLLWRVENLLIDFSYEIEELVETATDHPGVEFVKKNSIPPFMVDEDGWDPSDIPPVQLDGFDADWDVDSGSYKSGDDADWDGADAITDVDEVV